jgi:DNA-binding MarR family transcriptional regulator
MEPHEEGHDLAMALRGAYLTMHRRCDAFFVRYGVTADQYVLLNLLAHESGVTQQTLVVRASSDPNTVRAMLLLLEGRGFVTRERHPVDGRARSVSITKKGLRIFQRLQQVSDPQNRPPVAECLPGVYKFSLAASAARGIVFVT